MLLFGITALYDLFGCNHSPPPPATTRCAGPSGTLPAGGYFPPAHKVPRLAAVRMEREGVDAPGAVWRGTIPPATHISPFDSPQAQGWICEHSPRVLALCVPPAPPEDALGLRSKSSGTCTAPRPQEKRINCGGDLVLGLCVSKLFLSISSSLTSQGRCWDFRNKCTGGCTVKEDWNHAGCREKPSDKGLQLQQDITFWYVLTYLCSKTQPSATRTALPACPKKSRIPLPKPKP